MQKERKDDDSLKFRIVNLRDVKFRETCAIKKGRDRESMTS
jgi:hypothetical protein